MSIDLNMRYCQSRDTAPIDWYASIREADQIENQDDRIRRWEDLSQYSACWVTCAVGNQCAILQRDEVGAPLDRELYALGQDFNNAVAEMNAGFAIRTLNKIERRSASIIRTILIRRMTKAIDNILNDKSHGTRHVSEQKDLCSAVGASSTRG